jgi:uncharacterized cysteine cluster protein YcgN (CxxCxxCC family)
MKVKVNRSKLDKQTKRVKRAGQQGWDLLCDRGGSCGVRLGANADAMTALVSDTPLCQNRLNRLKQVLKCAIFLKARCERKVYCRQQRRSGEGWCFPYKRISRDWRHGTS